MERCSVEVSTRGYWQSHQCARKAVLTIEGKGYCKQHSPDRRAEECKRQQLDYAQERHFSDLKWQGEKFFEALLKISRGHNDPRQLALDALRNITGDKG
ncbi:hypothetical protein [Aestuariivirga sp.]|uniref:hypothetical protein n=1 Tax=Aestuariivirga sp. TaxID=2650926 RepID=UPI0039E6D131